MTSPTSQLDSANGAQLPMTGPFLTRLVRRLAPAPSLQELLEPAIVRRGRILAPRRATGAIVALPGGDDAFQKERPSLDVDAGPGAMVEADQRRIDPLAALLPLAAASPLQYTEEVAQRLERIATLLRERGPMGPLAEENADQLGALITGYLIGLNQAQPPKLPSDPGQRSG